MMMIGRQIWRRPLHLIEQAEDGLDPESGSVLMLLTYVKGKRALETDPVAAASLFETLKARADASGSLRYSFLAHVGLGLSYEKMKKWSDAESAFEKAVQYAENIRKTLDQVTKRTFLHGEEILGVKHVLPYEGLARVRHLRGGKTRFPGSLGIHQGTSLCGQDCAACPERVVWPG